MPITLKALVEERARLEIPVLDDKVVIIYSPGRLTSEFARDSRRRMAEHMKQGDEGEYEREMVDTFLSLVDEWDLLTEEGGPTVPLEADSIFEMVPIPFISACVDLIMGDLTPGEAKSGSSVVGYRTRGNSANSRTTTRSSGQRGTWESRRGSFSKNR